MLFRSPFFWDVALCHWAICTWRLQTT